MVAVGLAAHEEELVLWGEPPSSTAAAHGKSRKPFKGDAESINRRNAADDSSHKSRPRFGTSTKQPSAESAQPSTDRRNREPGKIPPGRADPKEMGSNEERQHSARSTSWGRQTGAPGIDPAQEQPVPVAEQPAEEEGQSSYSEEAMGRSEYGGQKAFRSERASIRFDDGPGETMEGSRPRSGRRKRQQAVEEIKAMLQANPAFAKQPAHSKGDVLFAMSWFPQNLSGCD